MIVPVILSGGAGSRLWPVSREGHPKPFIRLADGESLLLKTYRRAAIVATHGDIITVTNRDYYFQSKDEFNSGRFSEQRTRYLLEPFGRNTAPAIAVAALHLREHYGDTAIMMVMAADHLIRNETAFAEAVRHAAQLAAAGHMVTFGIPPTAAETGFGYIEQGDAVQGHEDGAAAHVRRFVEKPDAATAAQYLASGRYLWNSGMFCFQVGTVLAELQQHAPEVLATVQTCLTTSPVEEANHGQLLELDAAHFSSVPDISIDHAVMERSGRVVVLPAPFDWNDIGSWEALRQLVEPDEQGNRALGDALFVDCRNTFLQSEGRLLAAVGVQDLILVETADAVLAVHPDRVQEVRQIVQKLKQRGHESYKLHRTVARPWGTYTVLEEGRRFKIKRIVVKPGASLSLQLHHHRSEHWIVVQGMARVLNGDEERYVNTDESTYIPAGHRHRLENPGVLDLVMIEVQSGEYLGEDDIVRFADQYGRSS
ncbi:MAG: mannose-1-phosphate guanylyltransferase/mannose-6-phosphate isomerase [Sterolibacterium sp.]|nr:mannose-1-phosphate guanylyltransferase/mannose-6-phosphate isomerase [Sterolibacterium sp.]